MGLWQKPQHGNIYAFNFISVVSIVKSFKMHTREIHTIIQTDWVAMNLKWNYIESLGCSKKLSLQCLQGRRHLISMFNHVTVSEHQMPKFIR